MASTTFSLDAAMVSKLLRGSPVRRQGSGGISMVTKEELLESLQYMVSKVENPDLARHFQSFNRTMLMSFKDLGLDITIVFDNGTATVTEGTSTNPDLVVVTESETITGILGGSTSAMRAFMSGKIKVEGPTKDLLKIQRLLKA
ncbi:MAG: hypothetical protein EAX95_02245 [Candidatus Thorarchaeota archaeon]|nr:hypothetical protein [Candidatus Thorarchaeota archaeon]